MKKLLIVFVSVLFLTTQSKAQEAGKLAYEINDLYAHAGISVGTFNYSWFGAGSRTGFSVPLSFSVEYGFHEFLSVGGFVGISSYRYQGFGSEYRWSVFSFGGRGTFHFAGLMNENLDTNIDLNKFDLYLSAVLGLQAVSYKLTSGTYDWGLSGGAYPIFGPFFGAKYMFDSRFGAFVEAGRTTNGWFTLGVSAKFN